MENDRFWSILINANFESRSKIFDLFKKLQTLLLESIKIDERIQYVMIITFDCNLHLTLVWIGVVDAFLGLKEFVSFCKLLRQTDKDPFETLNINFSRKSTTESWHDLNHSLSVTTKSTDEVTLNRTYNFRKQMFMSCDDDEYGATFTKTLIQTIWFFKPIRLIVSEF